MLIQRVFIFFIPFLLASCGGGAGGDNPSLTGGGTSANPGQVAESVVEGNSITLKNVARYTVGIDDSSLAKDISIKVSQSDLSATRFNESSVVLDIEHGQNFEVVVTSPSPPTSDSFIELEVPADIYNKKATTNAFAIYFEKPDGEGDSGSYNPLSSTYNDSTKSISATIPAWVFYQDGEGPVVARLKIGVAKAGINQSPSHVLSKVAASAILTSSSNSGEIARSQNPLLLSCPVRIGHGCIEVSRFGPRLAETSDYHYGVDFRAGTGTQIVAEAPGVVVFSGGDYGSVTVKYTEEFTIRYMHLSRIDVALGQKINTGDSIGLSGKTSPPKFNLNPHLHVDLFKNRSFAVRHCFGLRCDDHYITGRVDPFPYFLAEQQLVRVAGSTSSENNESFSLFLQGKDKNEIVVSSEICNDPLCPPPRGTMRKVEWFSDNSNDVTIKSKEETGIYDGIEYGKDIRVRNYADVQQKGISQGSLMAKWEGLDFYATYQYALKPSPGGFSNIDLACKRNSDGSATVTGLYAAELLPGEQITAIAWTTEYSTGISNPGTCSSPAYKFPDNRKYGLNGEYLESSCIPFDGLNPKSPYYAQCHNPLAGQPRNIWVKVNGGISAALSAAGPIIVYFCRATTPGPNGGGFPPGFSARPTISFEHTIACN